MSESNKTTPNEEKRTIQQNKALHVWYEQLARVLNEEGKTMGVVLSKFALEVPATKYQVKEIWRTLQEAMYGKKSTTELLKKEEIDKIYDSLNKFFAQELEVQIPPFPSEIELNFLRDYPTK